MLSSMGKSFLPVIKYWLDFSSQGFLMQAISFMLRANIATLPTRQAY
jgi:hypothetical protein